MGSRCRLLHESQEAESKKAEAKMEQMMNDMEAGAAGTAGTCGQLLRKMWQMCILYNWLVDWNMNFMTSPRVGMMIQSDELIFFRGAETTNQLYNYSIYYIEMKRIHHVPNSIKRNSIHIHVAEPMP
jgi:hypothetical protein